MSFMRLFVRLRPEIWALIVAVALVSVAGYSLHPFTIEPVQAFTLAATGNGMPTDAAPNARLLETYGKLPLTFEANHGHADDGIAFVARGIGYTVALTPRDVTLMLRQPAADGRAALTAGVPPLKPVALRMELLGANATPSGHGEHPLPGRSSYFVGNDPSQWRTGIEHFARVRYQDVYSGVDLVYYGNQGQLEYDFIVQPGADPGAIGLVFEGARDVQIGAAGDLLLATAGGEIRQRKPLIYQEVNGVRHRVPGGYRLQGKDRVHFDVGSYDRSHPLVIDPVLVYATFLGDPFADGAHGVAVDDHGDAYVTGWTDQVFSGEHRDVFVVRVNRTGTAFVYAAYLSGRNFEMGTGIAVDREGNAYVTGFTLSHDFPITEGALQSKLADVSSQLGDGFVTKLNRHGSIVYSTFLGGQLVDMPTAIAVDDTGHAYVTGTTTPLSPDVTVDFPISPGAFQPTRSGSADAFVTKLDRWGRLAYSTFLGGSGVDTATGIAIDDHGYAYVVGRTSSGDFPTTAGAFQRNRRGVEDAFVAKINRMGSRLVYATYLGGQCVPTPPGAGTPCSQPDVEFAGDIEVDRRGFAYVAGRTNASDFPVTAAALQPFLNGSEDAFVAKLNRSGSRVVYSTYFGGSGSEGGIGIALGKNGDAYVTGSTNSLDLPVTLDPIYSYQPSRDERAGYVARFSQDGASLLHSSYIVQGGGFGIAVDAEGSVYVAGMADPGFVTTPGAIQPTYRGGASDGFLLKLHDRPRKHDKRGR